MLIFNTYNVTQGTQNLRESYRLFLDVAKSIRVNGQPLALGKLSVDDMLRELVPSFEDDEEGFVNMKIGLKINGHDAGSISYNTDGTVTHDTPEEIPETEPSGYLYSHYRKVQPPSFALPNVNWIVNANGTEFDPLSIERHLADNDAHEQLEIVRNYKRHDMYSLDETAREMAEVFRVDMDTFNSHHDRLAEIYAGNLQKCYTFSALRSFAWTLGEMADASGRAIEDYSIDELLRIIDFVADEKWLNYDHTGIFKGLCDHPDFHVMYVPDELCAPERSAELRTILAQMPVVSLDAFRECLQTLHPAMLKLVDYLAEDRDRKEQLTGNVADVLYAWCSLCVAAKEPFISEDGPMMCGWSYPGDELGYLKAHGSPFMQRFLEQQEQYEQERAQKKAQWVETYNAYISKHPSITIPGKKFVFTGLGVIKAGQKDQPIVQQVIARGGLFRQGVSGVTDYLVVGDDDPGETKIKDAIAQQKAGKPLQIIRLKDLEDALEGRIPSYPDDSEDIDEAEEDVGLDPEALSSIQDSLNKLNETMESMQGAFDQYSDLRKKQDEDKQRREQELQSARENAVVDADNDEACMFVVLSIIDELHLTDKYGSSEAFFECYGEDFPAYDADSLWALRCKVHANRNNEAQQAAYIRCFMMLDVKKRFGWTVTACVNISSVFDIGERINQAMELNARWFAAGEASAVQTELQKLKEDFRESLHSQFSAICKDWLSWTTAKPLLFVEYNNLPSAYDENTLSCQVPNFLTSSVRRQMTSMAEDYRCMCVV